MHLLINPYSTLGYPYTPVRQKPNCNRPA